MLTDPPGSWGPLRTGAPLAHIHLPKTAGSTFNAILRRRFPADRIYEHQSYFNDSGANGPALSTASRTSLVILGHLDFRCRLYLPQESVFVSFLRDPVQRVVSGYHNILRDATNPAHAQVSRMDLAEYVRSGAVRDVDNGQVRRLSGVGMDPPIGALSEEHLQLARSNIANHRYFIGITELFDQSLILLADLLGARPWHYVPVNTRTAGLRPPPIAEPEIAACIRHRNSLDLALYREQRERLEETIRERTDLDLRLVRFRRGQGVYRIATLPLRLARRARNRLRGMRS